MTPAVEAGSLTRLTQVAQNPPDILPEAFGHDIGTITLYIVRVPGSRDVFLTPLKPRERTVSAEDIQSALYYVHCNIEQDAELLSQLSHEQANHHDQRLATQTADCPSPPSLPPRPAHLRRKPVGSSDEGRSVPPALPRRPLPALPPEAAEDSSQAQSPSPSGGGAPEGYLTLIRREPATGEQWNVAKVSDSLDASQDPKYAIAMARQVKRHGAPLDIEVSNPSYQKFNQLDAARLQHSSTKPPIFRRRIQLAKSFSDHGTNSTEAHLDMRKAGYSFKSPWVGHCEFTMSSTGRALVCRHSQVDRATQDVSELRFNLSSASADLTARAHKRVSYVPADQRRSRMDVLRGVTRSEDGNAFDLDLSLGQELAGGGFGGRQPKLGKLIVHPQGLAMLDLLVAANLGLWWRAWEKVS